MHLLYLKARRWRHSCNILRRKRESHRYHLFRQSSVPLRVRKRNSSHLMRTSESKRSISLRHERCRAAFPAPRRLTRLSHPRPTPADYGNQKRHASLRLFARQPNNIPVKSFPEHASIPCTTRFRNENPLSQYPRRRGEPEARYRVVISTLLHSKLLAYLRNSKSMYTARHGLHTYSRTLPV